MARSLPVFDTAAPSSTPSRLPLFANGFRPFFLLAAGSAALLVPVWLLVLAGTMQPATHFDPVSWHAHEMVFGFAVAVISGFLLTAVRHWTAHETATGGRLGLLCLLWLAGRVGMSTSLLPASLAAAVDLAFLPALMIVLARPLLAAKSRRNLVILGILAALALANVRAHLGALSGEGASQRAIVMAVDLVVVLMLLISGRIVPLFTRNATGREDIRSSVALDLVTVASMAVLTVVDALAMPSVVVAGLAGLTAVLAVARAARWGTRHVFAQPLLWILHVGYFWIPLGLALRALGRLEGGPYAAMGLHAITAGAIGSLTLGLMARVALGHTGRALEASRFVAASFVLVTIGAALRVLAPLFPASYLNVLVVAATLWTTAFAMYVLAYAKILVSPRADVSSGASHAR